MQKNFFRNKNLKKRKNLQPDFYKKASSNICFSLRKILEKHPYRLILFYAPFQKEVDIFPLANYLLKQNKKIAFPKVVSNISIVPFLCHNLEKDLVKGFKGIREPKERSLKVKNKEIDIVVVSGLGFNKALHRLGYGGGYYDRFFSKNNHFLKIGCFFNFQYLSTWVADLYDRSLDMIITEKEIYNV